MQPHGTCQRDPRSDPALAPALRGSPRHNLLHSRDAAKRTTLLGSRIDGGQAHVGEDRAMTIFQLCFSPLCFVIATVMVRRILNGRYTLWKGLLWSLLWCLGGLLILLPELTTWAAQL